jgi:hypothetical protein
MNADHGMLLQNVVNWASNEEPPVRVTGPGILDVTVWRQAESMTVHLVNLTNPMMMKGPFREFIPVGDQHVQIRIPHDKKIDKVHLLVNYKAPPYKIDGETIQFTVPSILDREVIAIDFQTVAHRTRSAGL